MMSATSMRLRPDSVYSESKLEASNIVRIVAISRDADAEYYEAKGLRTHGLQKGLNIVKHDGKTYKIMVK